MAKAVGGERADGAAPDGLGSVIAEFELITRRGYGQFCALSRAIEAVGERWGLLIVRDLLVSAKTSAQLAAGLPRIPAELLRTRLREFEGLDIVRATAQPDGDTRYELTGDGEELREAVYALGRWGARLLDEPRRGEIVTMDAMITSMCASFDAKAANGVRVTYQIELGELLLYAVVDDATLRVAPGSLPAPDLVLRTGTELKALMFGQLDPIEAVETGAVSVDGDPRLLVLFTKLFHIKA